MIKCTCLIHNNAIFPFLPQMSCLNLNKFNKDLKKYLKHDSLESYTYFNILMFQDLELANRYTMESHVLINLNSKLDLVLHNIIWSWPFGDHL